MAMVAPGNTAAAWGGRFLPTFPEHPQRGAKADAEWTIVVVTWLDTLVRMSRDAKDDR